MFRKVCFIIGLAIILSANISYASDEFAGSPAKVPESQKSSSWQDDFKDIEKAERTAKQAKETKYKSTIELVQSATAKVEKPTGKFFNVLSPTPQENAAFERKFVPAFQKASANGFPKNPIKQLEVMTKVWKECGYSYDATFYHLFNGITPQQFMMLSSNGTMDAFIPLISVFEKDELLKEALKTGLMSRDSAKAYIKAIMQGN